MGILVHHRRPIKGYMYVGRASHTIAKKCRRDVYDWKMHGEYTRCHVTIVDGTLQLLPIRIQFQLVHAYIQYWYPHSIVATNELDRVYPRLKPSLHERSPHWSPLYYLTDNLLTVFGLEIIWTSVLAPFALCDCIMLTDLSHHWWTLALQRSALLTLDVLSNGGRTIDLYTSEVYTSSGIIQLTLIQKSFQ